MLSFARIVEQFDGSLRFAMAPHVVRVTRRFKTYYERCVQPLKEKYAREALQEAELHINISKAKCFLKNTKKYPLGGGGSTRREEVQRDLLNVEEMLEQQKAKPDADIVMSLREMSDLIAERIYRDDDDLMVRVANAQITAENLHDEVTCLKNQPKKTAKDRKKLRKLNKLQKTADTSFHKP